jgi:hypothetical protein
MIPRMKETIYGIQYSLPADARIGRPPNLPMAVNQDRLEILL